MEVVVPMVAPASPDFHFINSSTTSPYATAPSSPKPFGNPDEYFYCYTSAPASPTRASAVYSYLAGDRDDWEKLTTPRFGNNFDFAFGRRDVGKREEPISTADELFDKGRVKPLKPPPPRSKRGEGGGGHGKGGGEATSSSLTMERGRERSPSSLSIASSSRSNRRDTRSLPPLRGEGVSDRKPPSSSPASSTPASTSSSSTSRSGSKKWRLKDLLLFRSASEGRATGGSKDPLRKYTLLSTSFNKKRSDQENKSGSFSKTATSAHELHYTANRAAAEEQKKKTALPYHRNTFFGFLHFNPAVQSIAKGFGSNSFNRGARP